MDERVFAAGEPVYVLDLAVSAAAAVLERDCHRPPPERDLVSPNVASTCTRSPPIL
jgi:hypothetical protein